MASSSNTKTTMSYTSAIMTAGRATKILTTNTTQTFAAKLSEITASSHTSTAVMQSHTTMNKQQKPVQQANTVTVMSSTSSVAAAAATAQTSSQQSVVTTSPKHCRPLPTALSAAPPTIASHYPGGKSTYPVGTSAISSVTSTAVTNCSESSIVPMSTSSMRVTPSPPVISSQTQTLPPQQQQQQQSQQQQQTRSTTPMTAAIQEPQQQQQQSNSTPLEYSLFNDTFTKVTQQSMWGRDNESQKGMNFATVAGGGVSMNTSGSSTAKFDSSPPQVRR